MILKIGANNINGAPNPVYDLSISVANEIATGRIAGLKGSMLNAKEGKMHILSGANGPLKYGFENTGHILSVTIKYRDKNITDSSDMYICL